MKQKINIEDVCGKYNSARHENKGRKEKLGKEECIMDIYGQ